MDGTNPRRGRWTHPMGPLLAALAMVLSSGNAAAAGDLGDFLASGTPGFELRWRLEHVNQEPFTRDATALPLRTRLNYLTGDWHGLSLFAEYDYVFDLGVDSYNEGAGNTPTRTAYPVIADPSGGDLNQAYLQYTSPADFRLRGGRQRIIYDNARFVGNVGWRQNEQTYDAVSIMAEPAAGIELQAAWVWQVNRIFGNDVPDGTHDTETWLLNAAADLEGLGKLIGYLYEIDDRDTPAFSTRTLGLRFTGSRQTAERAFDYTLEYAYQEDISHNPVPFDADYWRAEASVALQRVTVYAGIESLGGDADMTGQAFRTPLATLHAFNGWADKFLITPPAGLVDLFGGVRGKLGSWSWNILYHDFSAESGSMSFGGEIDASMSRELGDHLGLLLKAARFDSDSSTFGDTTKLWLQLTARP